MKSPFHCKPVNSGVQLQSAGRRLFALSLLITSILSIAATPASAKNYFQAPAQRPADTSVNGGAKVLSPVKGVVKNEKGEALSNVTVAVKGSARQTLTNE